MAIHASYKALAEIQKAVSAVSMLVLFFVFAVLSFGLCTHKGCAFVLILGSTCANILAISIAVLSFRRLALYTVLIAQLCLVLDK